MIKDIEDRKDNWAEKSLVMYVDVGAIEEFLLSVEGRKLRCPIRNRGRPQKERLRESEQAMRMMEWAK